MAAEIRTNGTVELDAVKRVAGFLNQSARKDRIVFRANELTDNIGIRREKVARIMRVLGRTQQFNIVRRDAESGAVRWVVTRPEN